MIIRIFNDKKIQKSNKETTDGTQDNKTRVKETPSLEIILRYIQYKNKPEKYSSIYNSNSTDLKKEI